MYWGPEQQEAFETLQKLCTESPILAYADFKAPFVLHTDASGDGLGAVLYQVQDGQKRVIAYASRSFQKVKGITQSTNWNSLHSNGPSQINSMNICMVQNFRYLLTTTH